MSRFLHVRENGGGLCIPYTPEILAALVKLDPFERWSLLIASRATTVDQYIFNKLKVYPGSTPIEPKTQQELTTLLTEKGWLPTLS